MNVNHVSGYLVKKGEKGMIKGWKRRWFYVEVENPVELCYKTSPEEDILGRIHLRQVRCIMEKEMPGKEHTFVLWVDFSHKKSREYLLAAEDEKTKNYWINNLKPLIEEAKKPQSLMQAIQRNAAESAKQFLNIEKIDINTIHCFPEDCRTYLHEAVIQGNLEIVEALLAAKADVNSVTRKFEAGISSEGGKTPLDYAILNDHIPIKNLLLLHGAKPGRTIKILEI